MSIKSQFDNIDFTLDDTALTVITGTVLVDPGVGTYLAVFSMWVDFGATAASTQFQLAMYNNGVKVANSERTFDFDGSLDEGGMWIGMGAKVVMADAAHDLDIRYTVASATNPATAKRKSLVLMTEPSSGAVTEAVVLTDLNEDPGTSYTLLGGMTATPGAGDYLLLFSCSQQGPAGDQLVNFIVVENGTELSNTEIDHNQEGSIVDSGYPIWIAAHITLGASQTVEIHYKEDVAATLITHERNMMLMKLDSGDIFEVGDTVTDTLTETTELVLDGPTAGALRISDPGADTYLALFSAGAQCATVAPSQDLTFSMFVGGSKNTDSEMTYRVGDSLPDSPLALGVLGVLVPTAGQDLDVRWSSDETASRSCLNRNFVAVREAAASGIITPPVGAESLTGLAPTMDFGVITPTTIKGT